MGIPPDSSPPVAVKTVLTALSESPDIIEFVILTGMSGAGKSTALRTLEDIGFYCMDNLPPALLPKVAELSANSKDRRRLAAVCDVRSQNVSDELLLAVRELLSADNVKPTVVFLDAETHVLLRRFSETRRRHPLGEEDGVEPAIERERSLLKVLQDKADVQINTSRMSLREFQDTLNQSFLSDSSRRLLVTVSSFGFKHGLPPSADIVLDVRFLPNPFYVPELKPLTGIDTAVQKFVLTAEHASEFMARTKDWLDFLIPLYVKEGKKFLNLAIGCTGGHHRSVVIAMELNAFLQSRFGPKSGVASGILHRDITR